MIEQLMNECHNLAMLAGCSESGSVRLELTIVNAERKFKAGFYGDYICTEARAEEALRALKLKLAAKVEKKIHEAQKALEKQHEQLRKMETALQEAGAINGTQIGS